MTGNERRTEIINILQTEKKPLSGTTLADRFNISRQVIVQDMAILRAEGYDIISTNRGYLITSPALVTRTFKVSHTDEEIGDELNSIVDCGGTVKDVFVHHKAYGTVQAPLNISSRHDVDKFIEQIKCGKSTPLKNITSGYHYHTIEAKSEDILDIIENKLKLLGFLVESPEAH